MTNDAFLDIFKQLELSLRIELKLSERDHVSFNEMMYRSHRRVFKSSYHQRILENAAQLRNLLSHKEDVAIISPDFAAHFAKVAERVLNPLKAEHQMTPYQNVEKLYLEDSLEKAARVMQKNGFQNLPVIKSDRCIGMFNESTLFYALLDLKTLHVTLDSPLVDFQDYLYLEGHPTHQYTFVSRHDTLDDIAERFSEFLTTDDKRLELVIVTEHGKSSETMLGIISPEDLINIYMRD